MSWKLQVTNLKGSSSDVALLSDVPVCISLVLFAKTWVPGLHSPVTQNVLERPPFHPRLASLAMSSSSTAWCRVIKDCACNPTWFECKKLGSTTTIQNLAQKGTSGNTFHELRNILKIHSWNSPIVWHFDSLNMIYSEFDAMQCGRMNFPRRIQNRLKPSKPLRNGMVYLFKKTQFKVLDALILNLRLRPSMSCRTQNMIKRFPLVDSKTPVQPMSYFCSLIFSGCVCPPKNGAPQKSIGLSCPF